MSTPGNKPSLLMLEECFTAGDERFLTEFAKVNSASVLLDYLQKLTTDTRPWARDMLLRFLCLDRHVSGHQLFFKRLFKQAESTRDHDLMGAFFVALDRLVRRARVSRQWWNRQLSMTMSEEHLYAAPNTVPLPGKWAPVRPRQPLKLFSQRTRAYLRRRVWRYFRWLSYREPQQYISSMSKVLLEYNDDDFAVGENIIDNWSLMHACYFNSDAVTFTASHCNLAKGQSLASLSAAPYRIENWKTEDAFLQLSHLVASAGSSLIKIWAMELLQKEHATRLGKMPIGLISQMLTSEDQRVQQFAADVLEQHSDVAKISVVSWLDLLKSTHPLMLPAICRLVTSHVAMARLSDDQIVALANATATPIAELGFRFLIQRHTERPLSVPELVSLSQAKCEATAEQLATWVLAQLNTDAAYSSDAAIEFFDSLNESIRAAAMSWLEAESSKGHDDPVLWSRLIETPFDDVRLRLIRCLQARANDRRESTNIRGVGSLSSVWCSVLLGVHRGGREKLLAIDQMQRAILRNPNLAETLLPVLSVAARSLRLPERRRALSALAGLFEELPEVTESVRKHIPELRCIDVS